MVETFKTICTAIVIIEVVILLGATFLIYTDKSEAKDQVFSSAY